MSKVSPLGAVVYQRRFPLDDFLGRVSARLAGSGVGLGGLLQSSTGRFGTCGDRIEVVDLMTGARYDIWEDRGACASGCRLDERGLIAAAPAIEAAIAAGVDLIIINRFGRAESRGAGLLPSLTCAVADGIPVLTAVREPYREAWRQFHGGLATDLDPDLDAVVTWCNTAVVASGVFSTTAGRTAANAHRGRADRNLDRAVPGRGRSKTCVSARSTSPVAR
jgi:hypothetical protein